jgi:hypothetical protein
MQTAPTNDVDDHGSRMAYYCGSLNAVFASRDLLPQWKINKNEMKMKMKNMGNNEEKLGKNEMKLNEVSEARSHCNQMKQASNMRYFHLELRSSVQNKVNGRLMRNKLTPARLPGPC